MTQNSTYARGFTIFELAVVIAIIGILATIGMVSYGAYTKRAADKQAEADLGQAAMQLEKYKANNGGYPTDQSVVNGGKGLPKSDDERVYDYRATAGVYCLSTTVERTEKTWKIESGSSKSSEGDCSAFTTSQPVAPTFNNAGSDGLMSYVYWTLPSGVPTSSNIRISVACSGGGQVTFERASPPSNVSVTATNTYAWDADWSTAFSCTIGSSTIRVAYQQNGAWSSELVITPSMITVDG